ncbi:hypothetical protein [Bradyrhizobium sp. DASA03007]|uniref:hypothetical protein n=1 Tax=unclassified Bradyrhizobium TaxID=2631580 RepID=UPI003F70E919
MADLTFDTEAVELAKKLHRNFLKANQNTTFKSDWMEFYEQAARFLGKWHDPS